MGVASIYRPSGPEFEHCRYFKFIFMNSGKIQKVDFYPKNLKNFCHFQVEHMLEIHILSIKKNGHVCIISSKCVEDP